MPSKRTAVGLFIVALCTAHVAAAQTPPAAPPAAAAPAKPAAPQAKAPAKKPISPEERDRYAEREKQVRGLDKFEGGRGGGVPAGTIIIVLLLVIIIVLIV